MLHLLDDRYEPVFDETLFYGSSCLLFTHKKEKWRRKGEKYSFS